MGETCLLKDLLPGLGKALQDFSNKIVFNELIFVQYGRDRLYMFHSKIIVPVKTVGERKWAIYMFRISR